MTLLDATAFDTSIDAFIINGHTSCKYVIQYICVFVSVLQVNFNEHYITLCPADQKTLSDPLKQKLYSLTRLCYYRSLRANLLCWAIIIKSDLVEVIAHFNLWAIIYYCLEV